MRPGSCSQSASIVGLRYQIYLGGPGVVRRRLLAHGLDRNVDRSRRRSPASAILGHDGRRGVRRSTSASHSGSRAGRAGTAWFRELRGGIGVVSSEAKDDCVGILIRHPVCIHLRRRTEVRVPWPLAASRRRDGERFYKQKYPDSFYLTSSDNTSLLTTQARSFWATQTLFTVGASVLFDRQFFA